MKASWLPRDENVMSNMLSKEKISTWEFGLKAPMVKRLWETWDIPEVDCFASSKFHQLPAYYSFHPDHGLTQHLNVEPAHFEKFGKSCYFLKKFENILKNFEK